ncbi:MAG: DUF4398 domain-containing protein [Gammaproteobacteria bacterium]
MSGQNTVSWKAAILSLFIALLAGACASTTPPPTDEVAAAEVAVRRAEQSNASEFAALELDLAQKKLQQARTIATQEDEDRYPEALRLAEQARADARLAEAKASAATARRNEQEMQKTIKALREETQSDQKTR